ncbi:MAG TPA: hypothetical protein VME70_07690 [Mycobacteriales bacterium]|nr:hypothetical protein [Mycobacteriales bacterium]
MTGTVAILLALCAGLMASDRRSTAVALGLPFLAVLGLQTWGLWAGHGVNPPSTVNAFPGAISYYVVQIVIFGLAFAVADQLRAARELRRPAPRRPERALRMATAANLVIAAAVVGLWQADRGLLDPGNVHTHTGNGSPPVLGVLGMGALVVAFAVLTALSLRRRLVARRTVRTGVPAGG